MHKLTDIAIVLVFIWTVSLPVLTMAQNLTNTSDPTLRSALRDLIHANHILHYHRAVDAYGHVSIRHPHDQSVYIMPGYHPPALVSSAEDLILYNISDSSAISTAAGSPPPKGYSERFIHGEIFRRFPSVNCVIHSHAEEVLPYVVTGVPLKGVYHMAGFLGSDGVRVYDIDPLYKEGEQRDMLVNNQRFGSALAELFATDGSAKPDQTVVLMRRHGFTTQADNIVTAVYRAIYTRINAEAQTKAMGIATDGEVKNWTFGNGFEALTAEQAIGCSVMNEGFQDKPWRLWVREVERAGLYENSLN